MSEEKINKLFTKYGEKGYNEIYKKIMKMYDNNEITLEEANKINYLAYKKFVYDNSNINL